MWWQFFFLPLSEKRISSPLIWLHISFHSAFYRKTWYPSFFSSLLNVPLLFLSKVLLFFCLSSTDQHPYFFHSYSPLLLKKKQKQCLRCCTHGTQKKKIFFCSVEKLLFLYNVKEKSWLETVSLSKVMSLFEKEKLEWLMWQSAQQIMKINSNRNRAYKLVTVCKWMKHKLSNIMIAIDDSIIINSIW